MRYPILSSKDVLAFAQMISVDPGSANHVAAAAFCSECQGSATAPGSSSQREVDLSAIESLAVDLADVIDALPEPNDETRERVEGAFCGRVHAALVELPTEVLDDPRFWRFLAVRYFPGFVAWREPGATTKGNVAKYFEAGVGVESIPLRLFLRGQATLDSAGSYDLASAIPSGTDFWRSHVLRVRTGRAPAVTASFARMQATDRLSTAPLRALARLVNRMWANVVPTEYDEVRATSLLGELRDRVTDEPPTTRE